jgi:multicomponent Na+:H+ antiporter subunit E
VTIRFTAFHFFLAMLWVLLSDNPSWESVIIGLVIAQILWHGDWIEVKKSPLTVRKVGAVVRLAVRFIYELIKSNIELTIAVFRSPNALRPAIIAIPVEGLSDGAITLLGNMITLTPGTTTMDLTPDRQTLYIHAIFGADPEGVRAGIEAAFVKTIREIWR